MARVFEVRVTNLETGYLTDIQRVELGDDVDDCDQLTLSVGKSTSSVPRGQVGQIQLSPPKRGKAGPGDKR